jgi:hypothetical protein
MAMARGGNHILARCDDGYVGVSSMAKVAAACVPAVRNRVCRDREVGLWSWSVGLRYGWCAAWLSARLGLAVIGYGGGRVAVSG